MSLSYFQTVLTGKNNFRPIENALIQEFEQNFVFSTHLHSTVEMFFCLKGSLDIQILSEDIHITKGDFIIVFPDVPHSVSTKDEKCTIMQIHFHIEMFFHMFSDIVIENNLFFLSSLTINQKRYVHAKYSPQILSCMNYIMQELDEKETNYRRMTDLYFAQLILLTSRYISLEESPKHVKRSRHIVIALEYLEKNYMESIQISDIANYCGISTRRLLTLFHEHLNISPSSYLIHLRIKKSIEFMRKHKGGYSMTQLALDVGFGSLQHYSKTFKQVMGIPPTVFYSTRIIN